MGVAKTVKYDHFWRKLPDGALRKPLNEPRYYELIPCRIVTGDLKKDVSVVIAVLCWGGHEKLFCARTNYVKHYKSNLDVWERDDAKLMKTFGRKK